MLDTHQTLLYHLVKLAPWLQESISIYQNALPQQPAAESRLDHVFEPMQALLGERDEIAFRFFTFVSARKRELRKLSKIAETQDYETLYLKKFDLT